MEMMGNMKNLMHMLVDVFLEMLMDSLVKRQFLLASFHRMVPDKSFLDNYTRKRGFCQILRDFFLL